MITHLTKLSFNFRDFSRRNVIQIVYKTIFGDLIEILKVLPILQRKQSSKTLFKEKNKKNHFESFWLTISAVSKH